MHPWNPYSKRPPDYAALAREDDELAKHIVWRKDGSASIDYRDAAASRALTAAILRVDFGVHVTPREDRLCPPVPNRLNYIAWIEELLAATEIEAVDEARRAMRAGDTADDDVRASKRVKVDHAKPVKILDVGTGACCIYPVLGCALHPKWTFIATDIDDESLVSARAIIDDARNNREDELRWHLVHLSRDSAREARHLGQNITVMKRGISQTLLLSEQDLAKENLDGNLPLYHVTMCNPPFYSSQEDMEASRAGKRGLPSAVTDGAPGEMICDGGEVTFISQMIRESLALGTKVLWYTSMVGKHSSLVPLVALLREKGIDNYIITEFVQGARTRRWALAWSFTAYHQASPLVPTPGSLHHLRSPHDTQYTFEMKVDGGAKTTIKAMLCELLASLQSLLQANDMPHLHKDESQHRRMERVRAGHAAPLSVSLIIAAGQDTWSRRARRRASNPAAAKSQSPPSCLMQRNTEPALVVRIILEAGHSLEENPHVRVLWLYGRDHRLFQSFALSVVRTWAEAPVPFASEASKRQI